MQWYQNIIWCKCWNNIISSDTSSISKMKKVITMKDDRKQFPIRIDRELYKKLKIKATAKDSSVNEYVVALISADVDNVDLSAFID